VPISVWFLLLRLSSMMPLSILGLAYGSAPWIILCVYMLVLWTSTELRTTYRLKLLLFSPSRPPMAEMWRVVSTAVRDGLALMVVDLAVQLSLTLGIYVAASRNFEKAYALAAAEAAYWQFGPTYLVSSLIMFKIVGSQLIVARRTAAFARLYLAIAAFSVCMAVGAVVAAVTKRRAVAFDFGSSACIYASSSACAPAYVRLFYGSDSLQLVFEAFGVTVGLQMLFELLRAGLTVCHDFAFLAKAAVINFVVVFVPAIAIARFVFDTALAYYLAMYVARASFHGAGPTVGSIAVLNLCATECRSSSEAALAGTSRTVR
jgi:hypothetical protein